MYYQAKNVPSLNENEHRAAGDRKEAVLGAVEKANKRLEKRGYSERISVTIVREFFVEGKKGQWLPKFDFTIQGPNFAEGQWRFIAVIDHLPTAISGEYANIIRTFDPETLNKTNKNWSTHGPECVHCGLDRRRKQTIVVEKEGEVLQVGKTCLEAYTKCPAGVLVLNEIEKIERASQGGGQEWVYAARDIVACAVKVTEGATLYTKASEDDAGTKSHTLDCLYRRTDNYGQYVWEWPNDADYEKADTIIAWVADTFEYNQGSYQANVLSLLTANYVLSNHVGIMASLVGCWVREQKKRIEKATKANEWVSNVGDVYEGTLTLMRKPGFNTQYGYMTIYTFEDAAGNTLIWKTSSAIYDGEYEIGPGAVVCVKGKVKEHGLYKGLKQTVLTRCKVEVVSEAA